MKVLTVISNFNEENSINETIFDVLNNATITTDVLVIDNSSSDNSLKVIKGNNIDYLSHPVNTGGSAGVIKTAFVYASYYNYDVYCHMDGDNQHCASELEKLIVPLINEGKDIVIGSRFIKNEGFQSSFFRRVGIKFFSYILTKITKNKFTDITSGFRAYNKNAIEFFSKNFKHEIEASVQLPLVASFAGLKIVEVPVIMKPRTTGKSEINLVNAIKFPVYATISLIGTLLQKK